MHKLLHIHSKIGTETAFRIPVAVEVAIAEAVEAHDQMAARCNRLQVMAFDLAAKIESQNARNFELPQSYRDIVRAAFELIREPIGASLLLHDVQVIRDVADKLTFHNIDDCSYYKGYDHAILDVRAAADALEGEG
jgi:hypothetical protein